MALYPHAFIDDLRATADLVQVVQDYVPLKRSGRTFKGLCPFHAEKTPSFHVDREKGFFHCFGCGAGGDVFKFIELYEKLSFGEAVKHLAGRFGVALPEPDRTRNEGASAEERERLLKVHELAAARFVENLFGTEGARARAYLEARGLTRKTIETLGFGFAPPGRDDLAAFLLGRGISPETLMASGLAMPRDPEGSGASSGRPALRDRFRARIIVPICRDSGSVIAFAGRSLDPDLQPKYLNSPETPIYRKGRTLYGLNHAKAAMRKLGFGVIVEGYFDWAQAFQAGTLNVVATCGTALTTEQARLLHRYAAKAVLSFDPDTAGQAATARSCELLVEEGFRLNVAELPDGFDPDGFIRARGGEAYRDLLRASRPYLDHLVERTAERADLTSPAGQLNFLNALLPTAARVPDVAERERFVTRLAARAGVTDEAVRLKLAEAARTRKTQLARQELPSFGLVKAAERDLIRAVVTEPGRWGAALKLIQPEDVQGLTTEPIFQAIWACGGLDTLSPAAVFERLSTSEEQQLFSHILAADEPLREGKPVECAQTLKRLRLERARAAIQRELDEARRSGNDSVVDRLLAQKTSVAKEIAALS